MEALQLLPQPAAFENNLNSLFAKSSRKTGTLRMARPVLDLLTRILPCTCEGTFNYRRKPFEPRSQYRNSRIVARKWQMAELDSDHFSMDVARERITVEVYVVVLSHSMPSQSEKRVALSSPDTRNWEKAAFPLQGAARATM